MITTALAFTFFEQILAFLSRPLQGEELVAIEVTEPIGTVMRVSLLTGVALAFPYIALEVWLFVAPGLSRKAAPLGLAGDPGSHALFPGRYGFCLLRHAANRFAFLA